MINKIRSMKGAEKYLNSHIRDGSKQIFEGKIGLEKVRRFLKLLGSPQNKLKIIHIAGTAGKGSTCYLISSLLRAHGFKVGLHLSPHLTDVRERFQINNKIISQKKFVFYLNQIIPYVEKVEKDKVLSYFEILVGLAFHIFCREKVDYAVIETGLGGLYDATNIVSRNDKVAVLTKIGFDHMKVLGDTLKEIAFQKAMIINKNSQAVAINQQVGVKKIIKKVAAKKRAEIRFIKLDPGLSLALIGDYQKENASLALKTVELIAKRDGFEIDNKKVQRVFQTAHFTGRFDIKKINNKTVVLDGAHNPLKVSSFIGALKQRYRNHKFHFLVAFKKGKDYGKMLRYIIPLASEITITSFIVDDQDMVNLSEEPEIIGKNLEKLGFKNYEIISQSEEAFQTVLQGKNKTVIITGSLYLLEGIYKILKTL